MMVILLLAWLALGIAELRCVQRNFGAVWNGYGAIPGTIQRNNQAPMRYRVLVPWLIGWVPGRWRTTTYLAVKWLLMGVALAAAYPLLGRAGTVVLALLMAGTFEYDYWDSYVELLGTALCLYGNPWWALVGAVLWAMSKETVFLAPFLAFAAGGWMAGAAGAAGIVVWAAVHRYQGKAEVYSGRWSDRWAKLEEVWGSRDSRGWLHRGLSLGLTLALNPYTVQDFKKCRDLVDLGVVFSVAWTLAALGVALWADLPPALERTAWVGMAWLVAGWTLARARETRIFLPTGLWIAGALT